MDTAGHDQQQLGHGGAHGGVHGRSAFTLSQLHAYSEDASCRVTCMALDTAAQVSMHMQTTMVYTHMHTVRAVSSCMGHMHAAVSA